MKVIEETSDRLQLRANQLSAIILGVLFGTPFFIAGLFVIAKIGKLATLTCDRTASTVLECQLSTTGLLDTQTTAIAQLLGAEVQTSESSDGDTYRLLLKTERGEVPLTEVYSSGRRGKSRKAALINAFVSNPSQTSLTIQQDDRWFAYPFGGIFVLAGGGIIIGSLSMDLITIYDFDRRMGQLSLTQRGLFRTKVTEQMLHEIQQVQLQTQVDSDGDTTYSASFKLRSGEEMPLPLPGVSGKSGYEDVTNRMRKFLFPT